MHSFEQQFRKIWKNLEVESVLKLLKKYKHSTEVCGLCGGWNFETCSICMEAGLRTLVEGDILKMGNGDTISAAKVIAVLGNYKKNKNIYEIDEKLTEALQRSSFKDIPLSCLKMPKGNTCVLHIRNVPIVVTLFKNYFLGVTIPLEEGLQAHYFKMEEGIYLKSEIEWLKQYTGSHHYSCWTSFGCKDMEEAVKLIINCLLYVVGDKDVVREIHPGENPKKLYMRHRDPIYGAQPIVYKVGQKYRRYIERYELDHLSRKRQIEGEPTGRIMPYHIRAGYFGIRWYGVGRTEPRIKWTQQCEVNGHLLEFNNDDEPDITDVK